MAMAKGAGTTLRGFQATPATATLDEYLADAAGDYVFDLRLRMGTTGTATQADLELQKNGTTVATASVLNTESDGTQNQGDATTVTLAVGDRVSLVVTAVPTAGANLTGSCRVTPLEVE